MKTRINWKTLAVAACLVAFAVAAWTFLRSPGPGREAADADGRSRGGGRIADASRPAGKGSSERDGQRRIADATKPGRARPSAESRADDAADAAEEPELSPADQKLLDSMQDALDENDLAAVRRFADRLASHPSTEVRQRVVDALRWFGENSLDAMTPFLADADEDVRSSAMDAVDQALSEMEDEGVKLRYIEALLQIPGACSEDGLTMISGLMNGFSDQIAVVDTLVRIIDSNKDPAAAKEMREVYEFVTGDTYAGKDAAEAWKAAKAAEDAAD